MTEGETRGQEVARVRAYLTTQAARRTPAALVAALREAHEQFVMATLQVPGASFTARPAGTDWSAAEVLAHVLDVAHYEDATIVAVLQHGERGPDWSDDRPAPPVTSRENGLAELATLRETLIAAVLRADPEQRLDVTWNHPEFGSLQWREALLFARVHTLDHARQMAAIAAHFTAEHGATE